MVYLKVKVFYVYPCSGANPGTFSLFLFIFYHYNADQRQHPNVKIFYKNCQLYWIGKTKKNPTILYLMFRDASIISHML